MKVTSRSQVVLGEFFALKQKNKNQYIDVSHASGEVHEESTIKTIRRPGFKLVRRLFHYESQNIIKHWASIMSVLP